MNTLVWLPTILWNALMGLVPFRWTRYRPSTETERLVSQRCANEARLASYYAKRALLGRHDNG